MLVKVTLRLCRDGGGLVVATGTPEEIAGASNSHTGQYLKALLIARDLAAE